MQAITRQLPVYAAAGLPDLETTAYYRVIHQAWGVMNNTLQEARKRCGTIGTIRSAIDCALVITTIRTFACQAGNAQFRATVNMMPGAQYFLDQCERNMRVMAPLAQWHPEIRPS